MTSPGRINKAERNDRYKQALMDQGFMSSAQTAEEEKIEPKKRFLIVCEGANTEKYYFEAFPVPSKDVKVIGGFGGGKMYLVQKALEIAQRPEYQGYEVWCVFDFDVKHSNLMQKADFDNAINTAHKSGCRVAFSNDCFELWFLLHYKYIQNQHHRQEYFKMLSIIWSKELRGRKYEEFGKRANGCSDIYHWVLPYQERAINLAKRLYDHKTNLPFHQMNPCTTVYQLVQELNNYLRY